MSRVIIPALFISICLFQPDQLVLVVGEVPVVRVRRRVLVIRPAQPVGPERRREQELVKLNEEDDRSVKSVKARLECKKGKLSSFSLFTFNCLLSDFVCSQGAPSLKEGKKQVR